MYVQKADSFCFAFMYCIKFLVFLQKKKMSCNLQYRPCRPWQSKSYIALTLPINNLPVGSEGRATALQRQQYLVLCLNQNQFFSTTQLFTKTLVGSLCTFTLLYRPFICENAVSSLLHRASSPMTTSGHHPMTTSSCTLRASQQSFQAVQICSP